MKKTITIGITLFTLVFFIVPLNSYSISNQDHQPELDFRGNDGYMNSTCDNLAYRINAAVNSELPTPIKIEIIDPNGKVIGVYEDTMKGSLDIQIDVNYNVTGRHLIHFHYKGEIFEEDYGWSKSKIPSQDEQIRCLASKGINSGQSFESETKKVSDVEIITLGQSQKLEEETKTNPNQSTYANAQYEIDRCRTISSNCVSQCGLGSGCDSNECIDLYGCSSEKLKKYREILEQQKFEEANCGQGTHLENGFCVLDGEGSVCGVGTVMQDGKCVPESNNISLTENTMDNQEGGGCLIATVTYGSELAPQVQQLRELRDNKLLQTESGSAFMTSFNDFYYSFSPYIADYERENPVFKEAVKLAITPMISSLSFLNHVEMETDAEVLGYGISLILLNVGMYAGIPAMIVVGIRKKF